MHDESLASILGSPELEVSIYPEDKVTQHKRAMELSAAWAPVGPLVLSILVCIMGMVAFAHLDDWSAGLAMTVVILSVMAFFYFVFRLIDACPTWHLSGAWYLYRDYHSAPAWADSLVAAIRATRLDERFTFKVDMFTVGGKDTHAAVLWVGLRQEMYAVAVWDKNGNKVAL